MRELTDPRADRALAQIDGLTGALVFLFLSLLALMVPFALFGSGSVMGIGDDEVCASVTPGEVPGMESDARWHTEAVEVCDTQPSPAVRVAGAVGPAAEAGVLLGSLLLTRRAIKLARHRGLFAPGVASRVQTLGRFLVVAAPVSALSVALSEAIVLDAAVRGVSWRDHLLAWDFPWTLLVVGVGLVSMAKVMAYARLLQVDVDGTI